MPLVLAALLLGACDRGAAEADGLERQRFVATMVDLRRAIADGRFSESVRDSILEAHDVTADELRAWVTNHADDPQAYADTWREINETLLAPEDTADVDSVDTAADTAGAAE